MNIPQKDTGIRRDNDLMMESFYQNLQEEIPRHADSEGYTVDDYKEFEGTGINPADVESRDIEMPEDEFDSDKAITDAIDIVDEFLKSAGNDAVYSAFNIISDYFAQNEFGTQERFE